MNAIKMVVLIYKTSLEASAYDCFSSCEITVRGLDENKQSLQPTGKHLLGVFPKLTAGNRWVHVQYPASGLPRYVVLGFSCLLVKHKENCMCQFPSAAESLSQSSLLMPTSSKSSSSSSSSSLFSLFVLLVFSTSSSSFLSSLKTKTRQIH